VINPAALGAAKRCPTRNSYRQEKHRATASGDACDSHCRQCELGRYLHTWTEIKVLLRSHRRLIVHVLSLVLLLAQLGIQAHAYSHLESDPDGLPGTTTQLCGQCASSAPLLSMASSSLCIRVPYEPQSVGIAPASIDHSRLPLPHPAFRSRAPPHLL
jgi:hypothetical protein